MISNFLNLSMSMIATFLLLLIAPSRCGTVKQTHEICVMIEFTRPDKPGILVHNLL